MEHRRACRQHTAEWEAGQSGTLRTQKGRATSRVEAGHQRTDDAFNSAELAHRPHTPHSFVLQGLDAGSADLGSSIETVASTSRDVCKSQHAMEGGWEGKRARTDGHEFRMKSSVMEGGRMQNGSPFSKGTGNMREKRKVNL